jgi:hypothetical protein
MARAAAARQDDLIDAMAAHALRYDSLQPFAWRALADALARRLERADRTHG